MVPPVSSSTGLCVDAVVLRLMPWTRCLVGLLDPVSHPVVESTSNRRKCNGFSLFFSFSSCFLSQFHRVLNLQPSVPSRLSLLPRLVYCTGHTHLFGFFGCIRVDVLSDKPRCVALCRGGGLDLYSTSSSSLVQSALCTYRYNILYEVCSLNQITQSIRKKFWNKREGGRVVRVVGILVPDTQLAGRAACLHSSTSTRTVFLFLFEVP